MGRWLSKLDTHSKSMQRTRQIGLRKIGVMQVGKGCRKGVTTMLGKGMQGVFCNTTRHTSSFCAQGIWYCMHGVPHELPSCHRA